MIVEVAASSASYDLHDKLNTYQSNGVQEYVVWQIYDNELKWFRLTEGAYVRVLPDEAGIIRSQIFPGLHLAVNALLARDKMSVMATLQKGLANLNMRLLLKVYLKVERLTTEYNSTLDTISS